MILNFINAHFVSVLLLNKQNECNAWVLQVNLYLIRNNTFKLF